MLFFEFPEDARWSDDRDCVEFSVILRPYEGTARIGRRFFQGLLDQRPTPERCMEAFHLRRTRFELIVERKLRRRQLDRITDKDCPACDLVGFTLYGARRFVRRLNELGIAHRYEEFPDNPRSISRTAPGRGKAGSHPSGNRRRCGCRGTPRSDAGCHSAAARNLRAP